MPDVFAAAEHEAPAPSRAPSRAGANTKAFWSLMQRWGVPDATALALIGFPGKIGKSGKRPRFRLTTRQVQALEYLLELDRALQGAAHDPAAWLTRAQRAAPMSGRTPLRAMTDDGAGVVPALLGILHREVMRRAVRQA